MLNIETANPLSNLESILPDSLINVLQRIDTLRAELTAQEGPLWRYSASAQREELEMLEKSVRQLSLSLTAEQQNAVIRTGTRLLRKGRTGASALERFVLRVSRQAWLVCPDLNSPQVPMFGR
jgi:hypothetical protein